MCPLLLTVVQVAGLFASISVCLLLNVSKVRVFIMYVIVHRLFRYVLCAYFVCLVSDLRYMRKVKLSELVFCSQPSVIFGILSLHVCVAYDYVIKPNYMQHIFCSAQR